MKRDHLVGTIMHAGTPAAMLLLEFLGEGSTSVAYAFGDPVDGTPSDEVVKILKPVAWLEMETLHHDFAVHERLYPNHPLLMTAEQRFARLEAEILERIAAGRVIHRVSSYSYVLERTLTALRNTYFDAYAEAALTADRLGQHPGIRLFLDGNLEGAIQDRLDESGFVEKYEDFFAQVVALIPQAIEVLKKEGIYRPIARNPIASLAGLRVVDFVSAQEMARIASGAQFRSRIEPGHLSDAIGFGEVLYGCAGGRDRWMPASAAAAKDAQEKKTDPELSQAALAVYELTRMCAQFADVGDKRLAAKARADAVRASMLEGGPSREAVDAFEAALVELRTVDSPEHVHDVLVDLHYLYAGNDDARSKACLAEAEEIRIAFFSRRTGESVRGSV
jgi:hypothetical protein